MSKIVIFIVLVFSFFSPAFGQTVQTVHGRVVERNTQEPLPGVNIVITDADSQSRGTTTDLNGVFSMQGIPVGRCHIQATMTGFAPFAASNVLVFSGRETALNIAMEELVNQLEEVVVTVKVDKNHALNKMATVSARMLSSEEANRYAGSWGDPARMASNLAGVAAANDTRNDIIIRGNSPSGLLWRLDGFDIPNPNHFGTMGETGGPIGMLNNNQLTNSDFYTGAFPAEFGNATSGVFDLKMRNGNTNKHEFLASMGFNGLEAGAEGPISKKSDASYMINGRYSFLELVGMMGIMDFDEIGLPKYRDLCGKVNIPLRSGNLSAIVLLGSSEIGQRDDMKDEKWQEGDEGMDMLMSGSQVFTGVNYTARFSASTRLENRLSYQRFVAKLDMGALPYDRNPRRVFSSVNTEGRIAWKSILHHRANSRNFLMAGAGTDFLMTHLDSNFFDENDGTPQILHDTDGNTALVKSFAQWQHRFSDRLSITPGVYVHLFTFTGEFSAEPRFGLRWTLNERSSLSFGTGLHSQLQPRLVNFYVDDNGARPNAKLGMSRSWQTVAGYDLKIADGARLKTEVYYQHLYNIPVTPEVPQESILNLGDGTFNDWNYAFENSGTGRNYGVELTLEKFFERNWYFLMTASLYDARYRGYDRVERHSKYAGNYSFNVVAGYEWRLPKDRLLSVNVKTVYMGAKRYIPVSAPTQFSEPDFDWTQTYTQRLPYFFRSDLNVNMKQNFKRVALECFFEIFNLTNRKNIWQKRYNTNREEYEYLYYHLLMPIGGFRLYF